MELDEVTISTIDPAILRHEEAIYLCSEFLSHCVSPKESTFHMITYLDSFLFCFISIEEMVSDEDKILLKKSPIFNFLKAARNVTAHHVILAAPKQKDNFKYPFFRSVRVSLNLRTGHKSGQTILRLNIIQFRETFSTASEHPRGKSTLKLAEPYLKIKESTGIGEILFEEVMKEGLDLIASILKLSE